MAKKQNEKQINPADEFVDPSTMLDQAASPGDESIDDGTQEVVRVGVISVPVVPVFPPIAAPVEAPRIVDLVDVNLCVPLLADADDVNAKQWGWVSTKIDIQLDGDLALTFRRMLCAARQEHATYPQRGRMTHVESSADLVRWMIHTIGQTANSGSK